jgi:hypothetical protein
MNYEMRWVGSIGVLAVLAEFPFGVEGSAGLGVVLICIAAISMSMKKVMSKAETESAGESKSLTSDGSKVVLEEEWGDEDDPSGTLISAKFEESGLVFSGVDYGKSVEMFKGDDDYEYKLLIPKEAVNSFVLEILKSYFNSDKALTIYRIEEICKTNDIEFHKLDY